MGTSALSFSNEGFHQYCCLTVAYTPQKSLCNGGNASGKPCAIGSVGFPWLKLVVAVREVSYCMSHLKEKPNRHLEHTIIPEPPRMNSLEDFLDRFRPPLSFLQRGFHKAIATRCCATPRSVVPWSLQITQSRLHCTQRRCTAYQV